MHSAFSRFAPLSLCVTFLASASAQRPPQNGGDFSQNSQAKPLPADTILVKGAWASASDSVTPLPDGGSVAENAYTNKYFAVNYPLPQGWTQKYYGPPPSDTGYYVLAQIRPGNTGKVTSGGTILIAAQDLFHVEARCECVRVGHLCREGVASGLQSGAIRDAGQYRQSLLRPL